MTTDTVTAFEQFDFKSQIFKVLDDVGYETPSAIQAQTIPLILDGRDVIGQAQTGTGKTAAFALPILSNLDLKQKDPQVLVLAPTRELAIQVAEAFQKYATHLKGFHVLPVYGGQDYRGQIRALERGVHVVVGTPGRVMDHMRRGTLKLSKLKVLVLDEADEMLRMGFIDDVEWILEQTPEGRQTALFSATMPQQIRRIATRYLNNPEQITIKVKTTTAETIRQRYWPVGGVSKLDAITRILEAEEFDAIIVFVRTKTATVELTEKLSARGYSVSALNGDIAQNLRERTVNSLKNGRIDIIVATDVAARGLDVQRVSHVINYDIPYDTEAYVHRIGRTGRAGRHGDAILFVAPRERRLLSAIEKVTRKKIEQMELPSTELINDQRVVRFKQRIADTVTAGNLDFFQKMLEEQQQETETPAIEIAAALAKLLQGDAPFLLQNKPMRKKKDRDSGQDPRSSRRERERSPRRKGGNGPDVELISYRIEVGRDHNVKPGNIVGAIANEAGLDSKNIGSIDIHESYSLVDLPKGMPKEVFDDLKDVWVSGQKLNISQVSESRGSRSEGSVDKRAKLKMPGRSDSGDATVKKKAKKNGKKEWKPGKKY